MQAERACLGAALLDNSLLRGPLSVLAVDDFFLSANREIFGFMLEADSDCLPFDILTLSESLQRRGRLDAVGDVAYLDSLTDGVVIHRGLIERHAETVLRFSRLRRLQKLGNEVSRCVLERDAEPDQILGTLEAKIELLHAGYDLEGHILASGSQEGRSIVTPALMVQAEPGPSWIAEPYIPAGRFCLLGGDPGSGKTRLAAFVAARVTRGEPLFFGASGEPGKVLFLSNEDTAADVRRFVQEHGGDLSNVLIEAQEAQWNLTDISRLERAIRTHRPRLAVLDTVTSHLPDGVDTNKAGDVAPLLNPLSKLAQRSETAVFGLMHLSKAAQLKALYRVSGSTYFVGASRSVLMFGRDPEDEQRAFLSHVKNNLGPLGESLAFQFHAGVLTLQGACDLRAADLSQPESGRHERAEVVATREFLAEVLKDGPKPAKEVLAEAAEAHGVSEKVVRRTARAMGVRTTKTGLRSGWMWSLPTKS